MHKFDIQHAMHTCMESILMKFRSQQLKQVNDHESKMLHGLNRQPFELGGGGVLTCSSEAVIAATVNN